MLLTCIKRYISLEKHFLVFLRVAVLKRFYCILFLFVLMLYNPGNKYFVMLGHVLLTLVEPVSSNALLKDTTQ